MAVKRWRKWIAQIDRFKRRFLSQKWIRLENIQSENCKCDHSDENSLNSIDYIRKLIFFIFIIFFFIYLDNTQH